MSAWVPIIEITRSYVARGWRVIPIPYKQKRPVLDDWPLLRLTEADLPRYFDGRPQNVGVLLGEPSNGLVDVDLDVPEAIALADDFLPETKSCFGRHSKRASHREYVAPLVNTTKFQDVEKTADGETAMIVELRSTGAQTVFPGSLHPGGEAIEWQSDGEPARVDGEDLLACVKRLAIAALLARHWPDKGARHEAALAAAGLLLRAGTDEDLVRRIIGGAARVAKDEEWSAREDDVCTTAARLRAGKTTTGGPTITKLLRGDGLRVVERLVQWLGTEPWPEPQPIQSELAPVPAFNRRMLPPALADWVWDIAERAQCPPDFVAVGAVVALAAVLGRKIGIRPKRHDDWTVVPNLWGMIIGRPGVLKTPALAEAMRPLYRLAADAQADYEKEIAQYRATVAEQKAQREVLEARLKTAVKKGAGGEIERIKAELVAMSENEPPVERRYVTNDTTIEKLGELLNQNPNGLLVFRDELAGFLAAMDRQGHESDRAFYLEAWNGTGAFTYDRIGRGTLHIKAACVSILGSIQPGPLVSYLREAFGGGRDDGFIQRFQLAVYPDTATNWRNVDRWPDSEAKSRAFKVFKALDTLNISALRATQKKDDEKKHDEIPYLRFSPDAQDFFDTWRADLEKRLRSDDEHPVIVSHLAKYRSLMPSLALLFYLVEAVGRDGALGAATAVSLHAARRAAAWCDYLEAHARRIYQSLTARVEIAASILAAKIRAGKLPDPFTPREVMQKGWTGLTTAEEIAAALDLLEELHWLRREEIRPAVGRPSVHYRINSQVSQPLGQ